MAYLEEYVAAMEKVHGRHAKEYEKALKVNSCATFPGGSPIAHLLTASYRQYPPLSERATTSTKASVELPASSKTCGATPSR